MESNEHTAKVIGRDLSISTKQAIEISNFIRGRTLEGAKKVLQRVLDKKQAVPFKRFHRDMGHKPGRISSGRYPEKSTEEIISLLKSAESNAQDKGLNTEDLVIKTIIPNKASRPPRYGRKRRRRARRTHVEIVVEEREIKRTKKPEEEDKKESKPEPKKETKPKTKTKEKKEKETKK